MDQIIVTPSGRVRVDCYQDDAFVRGVLERNPEPAVHQHDASAPRDLVADRYGTMTWAELGRA